MKDGENAIKIIIGDAFALRDCDESYTERT